MNDLCSPMIVLLENEADAFWCFEHLMRRMVCIIIFTPLWSIADMMCKVK